MPTTNITQHQRPAAADAEQPVIEPERRLRASGARPCQRALTKPNGVRHCSRQRYLSALNWNSAGAREHRRADDPAVRHAAIAERAAARTSRASTRVRDEAEREPRGEEARRRRSATSRAGVGARCRDAAEDREQRTASSAASSPRSSAPTRAHAAPPARRCSPCGNARQSAASAPASAQPPCVERSAPYGLALHDQSATHASAASATSSATSARASRAVAERARPRPRCRGLAPAQPRDRAGDVRRANTNVLCSALWPLMSRSMPSFVDSSTR